MESNLPDVAPETNAYAISSKERLPILPYKFLFFGHKTRQNCIIFNQLSLSPAMSPA